MAKLTRYFILLSALIFVFAPAFADQGPEYQEFQMWTVATSSPYDTTPVNEFNLGSTPYLYIQLPTPPQEVVWYSDVDTDWFSGLDLKGESDRYGFQSVYHIALDGYNWSDPANVGTWTINADYWYKKALYGTVLDSGIGYTTFTMKDPNAVPEPVSTVLFLAGGSALAGRRLFRRK